MKACIAFFKEETAATAVEYSVMLALVLVTIIVAITAVGGNTANMWGSTEKSLIPGVF